MKKKKWLYIAAAAAVLIVAILMLSNPETARQIPAMLISVAVGVALMLSVVLLAIFYINRNRRREENFRNSAVEVIGRVTKVERLPVKQREAIYGTGEDLYILRASYEYQGKTYKGAKRSYFGRPNYQIGDSISIYVDPKEPSRSKILEEVSITPKESKQ